MIGQLVIMSRTDASPPECIINALVKEATRILQFGPFDTPPPEWYLKMDKKDKPKLFQPINLNPNLNPNLN